MILIMADESKVRVRLCATENCTVRMSSLDKDRRVVSQPHRVAMHLGYAMQRMQRVDGLPDERLS